MGDAMHTDPIRRSNGTVDIEFYRERALTMRAQARTRAFRSLSCMVRPLIAIAILVFIVVLLPLHSSVPASGAATTLVAARVATTAD
jgi:hypothetical protein